jgi:hypothetical protein
VSSTDLTHTSDFVKIGQPDSKFKTKIKENMHAIAILKVWLISFSNGQNRFIKLFQLCLFIALTHDVVYKPHIVASCIIKPHLHNH